MDGTDAHRRGIVRRAAVLAALMIAIPVAVTSAPAVAAGATPLSTGLNADGQLGNGTTTQRLTTGAVNVANVVQIASGREHAYALDDQGRVWAWGDNSKGAVGNNSSVDRPAPVVVLTGVAQIEAGHYHGIARKTDGTVWTWGYGALGQLGLGTTTNRLVPTQVPGITGAIGVAAGRDMSYVLMGDRTVRAFGGNTFGEVGDGTTTRRTSPVSVQGLTNVVELVGGRNHGLALRTDGTLWVWGANDYGQLGVGSTTSRSTPIQVLANVRSFDAGAEHTVVVMNDGTVRTWGRGQRGQLGLGTTSTRTSPQVVPGLSGIVEVGDGRDQSFAMNAAGQVWAWGFNDTGQLGDGTTTQRNAPVRLTALTGIVAAQGGRGMTIFLPGQPSPPPDPDVTAPTAPGQPTGTSTVAGRADLTWPAATDDRATTLTYRIYRDGGTTAIGQVVSSSANPTFSDLGLASGSQHTWEVEAFDGTNTGPRSPASAAITIAGGGTGPTELLSIDFAAGLAGFTGVTRLTVDNTQGSPTDAAPSARVAVVSQSGTGRVALTATTMQSCTSVDVQVGAVSGTERYALIKLRNSAGNSLGRVQIDSALRLSVRADVSGATLNTTTPATLALNTWSRVTLCALVAGGTSGQLSLRLNGVTIGTWAADTGTSPLANIQVGDNDARTATVNWDDLVVTEGLG